VGEQVGARSKKRKTGEILMRIKAGFTSDQSLQKQFVSSDG
jgi:hypothetical protein